MNNLTNVAGVKLALCGGMRAGKDEVAAYLCSVYGFQRFAFGDGIRQLCRDYLPELMEAGKPRALLQGIGQDLRKYDPDVWVKWLLVEIEAARYELQLETGTIAEDDLNVVVSDLRQPNEYARLRAEGYRILRVNASDEIRRQRMRDAGDIVSEDSIMHETESHYAGFAVDLDIWNNGNREELYAQIDSYLRSLK